MKKQSLAIFASGSGSNALAIIQHFKAHSTISVGLVICNNPDAPVVEKVRALDIPVALIDNAAFEAGSVVLETLAHYNTDWIVLAGFLRKLSPGVITAFTDRIINIHPALLPKFGGKGMYGIHVHRAVIEAKETESGITIHLVNEEYDKGKVLAQYSVTLDETDSPETVAKKVQELEHRYFPGVVEEVVASSN